jgi:hypothetical protein
MSNLSRHPPICAPEHILRNHDVRATGRQRFENTIGLLLAVGLQENRGIVPYCGRGSRFLTFCLQNLSAVFSCLAGYISKIDVVYLFIGAKGLP